MRKVLTSLFLAGCVISSQAVDERIAVGIYTDVKVRAIEIAVDSTQGYVLYADRTLIKDHEVHGKLRLDYREGKVQLVLNGVLQGKYQTVEVLTQKWDAYATTRVRQPELSSHAYHGDLIISSHRGRLQVVNELLMEHYIAGVVEAETGLHHKIEFYKAQAIIARTYALSNTNRHGAEGYSMCDQVHCQVYHKRTEEIDIMEAAFATTGIVLVDANIELIIASYHSNCGGQTVNSEDVWTSQVSYLRSKPDTFCRMMPHALWEREINTSNWLDYLNRNFAFPSQGDTMQLYCAVDYQPYQRELFFADSEYHVPLKRLRKDWQLKSTYFSVSEDADKVVLQGRGYGHGVGLCQEGAIRMGELGFQYQDILHYYYSDVHLVQLEIIDFFRE